MCRAQQYYVRSVVKIMDISSLCGAVLFTMSQTETTQNAAFFYSDMQLYKPMAARISLVTQGCDFVCKCAIAGPIMAVAQWHFEAAI
jgi:hypothetical protein